MWLNRPVYICSGTERVRLNGSKLIFVCYLLALLSLIQVCFTLKNV